MEKLAKDFEFIVEEVSKNCKKFVDWSDKKLMYFNPLEIVILTLAGVIVLQYVACVVAEIRKTGLKIMIFRFATKLPFVSGKIAAEG